MYSSFQLIMAATLSALVTGTLVETLHFVKDRKKEKADK